MFALDIDFIESVAAGVARAEIMPRYGNLRAGEIKEKSPGDWLTIADTAAEDAYRHKFAHYIPGSFFVGEESFDADPAIGDYLKSDGFVWVIDPIDGTTGFKNGDDTFVTMIALRHRGETIAACIHHPVSGDSLVSERGSGVWLYRNSGKFRMRLAANDPSFATVRLGVVAAVTDIPGFISFGDRYYPTGGAYGCMFAGASGKIFSSNGLNRVSVAVHTHSKPWDHYPGLLMVEELGGHASDLARLPYQGKNKGGLIVAPSQDIWEEIMRPGSPARPVIDRTIPLCPV
jgi:fructose-1,6-bisphosphatase/inositol monophosphatase family enzyme